MKLKVDLYAVREHGNSFSQDLVGTIFWDGNKFHCVPIDEGTRDVLNDRIYLHDRDGGEFVTSSADPERWMRLLYRHFSGGYSSASQAEPYEEEPSASGRAGGRKPPNKAPQPPARRSSCGMNRDTGGGKRSSVAPKAPKRKGDKPTKKPPRAAQPGDKIYYLRVHVTPADSDWAYEEQEVYRLAECLVRARGARSAEAIARKALADLCWNQKMATAAIQVEHCDVSKDRLEGIDWVELYDSALECGIDYVWIGFNYGLQGAIERTQESYKKREKRLAKLLSLQAKMPRVNGSYRWPRGFRFTVYDAALVPIEQSKDRQYDLNDNLFQAWGSRIVYLGVEVHSKNWPTWNKQSLSWIERRILWDLHFDGNEVDLTRQTRPLRGPCTEEFIWKLDVNRDLSGY